MSLLTVSGLSKSFGGLRALNEVAFSIEPGETLGLMGANGAGKTTLFSVVAGHIRPESGTLRFDDHSILGLRPDRVCKLGIARTFQIVRPFRGLSVLENVTTAVLFGREPARDSAAAERRALAILDDLGLADRAADPAGSLTLAGQKRLEVAKALGTGPRLLLLDEVMAGLTPAEVAEMETMIRRLKAERGLTIFMVEHVMQALMALSERVLVLHHGELISEGSPEEVSRDPRVIAAYIGEDP